MNGWAGFWIGLWAFAGLAALGVLIAFAATSGVDELRHSIGGERARRLERLENRMNAAEVRLAKRDVQRATP